MEKLVGACGFKCYLCAAFTRNIASKKGIEIVKEKWNEYYSYELESDCLPCGGCMRGMAGKKLPHVDCEFRICAVLKGVEHCSECNEYLCNDLMEHLGLYSSEIKVIKDKVPNDEQLNYVDPYINIID